MIGPFSKSLHLQGLHSAEVYVAIGCVHAGA